MSSFEDYLDEAPESSVFLKDLSYTLGQRRTHFPYRVAVVTESVERLQESLSALKPARARERYMTFAFTGQGAQYAQMASGLECFPVFAHAMADAEAHLQRLGTRWSLSEELAKPAGKSRVNEAEISQPACTAIQLGLVALLGSWNITPTAVTGHSSGEIAAAFAAGLITFEGAMAISYFRGQAAARLAAQQEPDQRGAMLALGISAEEASTLIDTYGKGYATVAAVNSPSSVTVSGDQAVIENVHQAAQAKGLFARKLKVEMAYHSRHMSLVADYYLDAIQSHCTTPLRKAKQEAEAPRPAFVSSVTGHVEDTVDAAYWVKNLVRPVMFADAIQGVLTLHEDNKTLRLLPKVMLEIGPHAALKGPIKQTVEALQAQKKWSPSSFSYAPSLLRDTDAERAVLDLAGSLYTLGAPIGFAAALGAVNQTDHHNASVVTELPSYAWDKTNYELRPRVTHEKYFPGEDYHPLLGRRVNSNSGQERTYRQVFTLDEMPWIRDHVVGGATIFPMTAYMSMAIEAARRTLTAQAQAAAFLVTDFHVARSLEIHEEETIELVTKLRPAALGEGTFSTRAWFFEVMTYSQNKNEWNTHCWGQIEPEMTEMSMATPTFQASIPLVNAIEGLHEHDIDKEYEKAALRATQYGPSFKNNVRFFEGKGYTVLHHELRDLGEALSDPYARGSPVSVDPPTLDGFLQGGGPLQYDENGRRPAQMPNYISRFRVSNKIPSAPKQRFDAVMRRLDYDVKGGRMHVSVAAFARGPDNQLTPIAEWDSAAFRNIGSAEEIIDPAANVPENWAWEMLPKYDFLPADQLRARLRETAGELGPDEDSRVRRLGEAGLYYISKALEQTAGEDSSRLPHHLARFVHWGAKKVAQSALTWDSEPTELLHAVKSNDAQGEMLCLVGEKLVEILHGDIEPLEIMLKDGLLTRNYETDVTNAHLSQVLGYFAENLADLEPNQRILEIGAGTAGTTLPVLEGLSRGREEPGFLDYTFTDISTGFFENARTKLDGWAQRITYKKLDISLDPSEQGFSLEEYDVVIASNVLHATQDMVATMTHVRKLLKPGGKLFLLEGNIHPTALLPFTLLPGWWAAEDQYRDNKDGPMMPVATWDRLLQDVGFAGVEVRVPCSYNVAEPMMSVMTSTRIGTQDSTRPITICGPFGDDTEVDFAHSLADLLEVELGAATEVKPLAEVDPDELPFYIFLDSTSESIMKNMNPGKFQRLQDVLLHNTGILWITPEGAVPDAKIIRGMMRTLRLEQDAKNLILFEDVPSTPAGARGILRIAGKLRDPEVTRDQDQDLVWRNGSVHFPRMRQLRELKEQFAVEQNISFLKEQNIWESGDRPLEMTIDAAGSPDTLYFRRTEVGHQPLGDDEVIVQVEAAGACHRDLEVVLGTLPWAPPGFDGAGKIVRTGSHVTHVREGDDIFFLSPAASAFATHRQLPAWQVARIPHGMSTIDAATIPLAYTLAVLVLVEKARLRKGETVLIHSATGAVGQACIVLAQHIGARVFATASSEEKRDFLHATFDIPRDQLFDSRTPTFRDSIICATDGTGIDVIVNSLSGELMTETWALAAPFGRFVEVGNKDVFLNNSLPMRQFKKNVTFSGVDLRELYSCRADDIRDLFAQVVHLVRRNEVKPIGPATVYPISQFSAALRKLRSGDHMGKIVITLGKDQSVVAESPLRPSTVNMKADATYVVAGGTRGIGLDLVYWLIEHGARHVVVLGRSGSSGPEVQKLLAKYQGTDVTVRALACNVGVRDELVKVMEAIADLPPIKGVVQSALLLSVSSTCCRLHSC